MQDMIYLSKELKDMIYLSKVLKDIPEGGTSVAKRGED
jgi:hypothetical protein